MKWLAALRLALTLAAYFARRAERRDIEDAILAQLQNTHRARVDDAVRARDDVLSGRVPDDAADPYRRD